MRLAVQLDVSDTELEKVLASLRLVEDPGTPEALPAHRAAVLQRVWQEHLARARQGAQRPRPAPPAPAAPLPEPHTQPRGGSVPLPS